MIPPLLENPPNETLPDPSEDTKWYGEIWVQYPLNQNLSPTYFGHVFRAKCQFRVIMNKFCHAAYSKTPAHGIALDRAYQLYLELREWYNSLRGPLLPRAIVLPAQLQLQ